MTGQTKHSRRERPIQVLLIETPVCQDCQGDDLQRTRTKRTPDGDTAKSITCRTCGKKFTALFTEVPPAGNTAVVVPHTAPSLQSEIRQMDIRIDITSIGRVAGELQIPLCDIRDAAEQLGIRPHHVNGVVHFDTDDVRRIDRHIHGDQRPEANARH